MGSPEKGRDVYAEPRGLRAGYHWPQYSPHRGKLQMLLYRTVLDGSALRRSAPASRSPVIAIPQRLDDRCGALFDKIDDVIPKTERKEFMHRYKVAAGFAAEMLNTAGPLIPAGAQVRRPVRSQAAC